MSSEANFKYKSNFTYFFCFDMQHIYAWKDKCLKSHLLKINANVFFHSDLLVLV